MIVPKYWAEGRVQQGIGRKQVAVRRYGWSDESPLNAQVNADARAHEALARILSGEKLRRRERKVPYNGADGLPIREEILSTHGETVITRNSYGAHCLNTPNVLFADVDLPEPKFRMARFTLFLVAVLASLAFQFVRNFNAGYQYQSERIQRVIELWAGAFIVYGVLLAIVEKAVNKRFRARVADRENAALARIRHFSTRNPSWGLRVYRTPAGFRVLASHATFAANQPEVAECFSALGVDPIYARMCFNQHCFRARLTAKPWRMGRASKQRQPYGVWPVKPELLPERAAWAAKYERAAANFAACHFIETLGNGIVHPDARGVIELHDAQCRAVSQLPLA